MLRIMDDPKSRFATWMPHALEEARAAQARGEVPVGAVVVSPDGRIVSRAGNETRESHDPSAHAEMLAIRRACQTIGSQRLIGHSLWVTLEPCPMCAAGIAMARIDSLYYGASDPKSGGIESGPRLYDHPNLHHRPDVYAGIAQDECVAILRDFFRLRR
jgi:cytidine deaminase